MTNTTMTAGSAWGTAARPLSRSMAVGRVLPGEDEAEKWKAQSEKYRSLLLSERRRVQ